MRGRFADAEAAAERGAAEIGELRGRLADAEAAAERSAAEIEDMRGRLADAEEAAVRSAAELGPVRQRLAEAEAAAARRAEQVELLYQRLAEAAAPASPASSPNFSPRRARRPASPAGAAPAAPRESPERHPAAAAGAPRDDDDEEDNYRQQNPDLNSWTAVDGAEEDAAGYRPGGYHPVSEGDVYGDGRYRVVAKLGWGESSTVWLALDAERGHTPVALKISKSAHQHSTGSRAEITFFKEMNEALESGDVPPELAAFGRRVLRMLDQFTIDGPHGSHPVTVLEALGPNLLALMVNNNFSGLPTDTVRVIARQALEGLAFLHEVAGVVHTDLKPENILLCTRDAKIQERLLEALPPGAEREQLDPDGAREALCGQWEQRPGESRAEALGRHYAIKISDLGTGRWASRNYPAGVVGTREYRSPEILLGMQGAGGSIDMWALACILFELLTGSFLFDPKNLRQPNMDATHLALFMHMLGPLPQCMTRGPGEYVPDFFDNAGEFLHTTWAPYSIPDALAECGWEREDAETFCSFIMPMLEYDPAKRASARECLGHPWLEVRE
eukprot:TRINITY_DN304_c1_g1_i3.p1 TRINITY_DN304_c1_g1~~TRINITY_DN304_c1_g1_i3.p1  ORF type:complete len:560 (+),score=153.81 TRINITY_DN304_c1_g1_i3:1052-2731(+)